jgi:hypothetical protein
MVKLLNKRESLEAVYLQRSKERNDLTRKVNWCNDELETLKIQIEEERKRFTCPSVDNVQPFYVFDAANIGHVMLVPAYSNMFFLAELTTGKYDFNKIYSDSAKDQDSMIRHLVKLGATFTNKQFNIGEVK